jgi:UDP-N-acetylmuramoyl-tripeptide--D-alanyl-D-alanine ligase
VSLHMTLSEIARAVDGRRHGDDVSVNDVTTDTRALGAGDLFIALKGERFDGHDFIAAARDGGAAAAMVSRTDVTTLPVVRVDDTRRGLARLAEAWRGRFSLPLVGVTGSNGKTTVKEMIAAVLRRRGATLATEGNKNNDIGMPLMLLRLTPQHAYAVIEMGANHPGEIAVLSALARPTVAVITNAGPAHLKGFGSLDGVARAKGELLAGLAADGVAVLNADDTYYPLWRELAGRRRCVSCGVDRAADVTAAAITHGAAGVTFDLRTPNGTRSVSLRLAGVHNVRNALAAAAAALAAGADMDDVKRGLEAVAPVHGRLDAQPGIHGSRLIDDTYNANPASLQAALQTLAAAPGDTYVVLGDMYELGDASADLHEQAGRWIREAGVKRLFALGEHSRHAVRTFGGEGRHFADRAALIEAVGTALAAAGGVVTVLVKGSRGMAMEAVVVALRGGEASGAAPTGVKHTCVMDQARG